MEAQKYIDIQVPLLQCVTKEVTNLEDVVVRDMNNIFAARDSEDEKRIFVLNLN